MPLIDNVIMQWNGALTQGGGVAMRKITDHNRSALNVDYDRIEKKKRMANGTLRKYVVAKKRTYSCTWDLVPSRNDVSGGMTTADGGIAAKDIESFTKYNDGAFTLRLTYTDGTAQEDVTVMISDFSKEVAKRGKVELWNLSITLEEV